MTICNRDDSTRISVLLCSVLVLLFYSCVSVPLKEFSSYRDAVDQARVAGEQLLIDFASAKSIYESSSPFKTEKKISSRHTGFNPSELPDTAETIDSVAVRLKAWEILVQYNTALEAVMLGKEPSEIEAATRGLLNTMSSFPSNRIKDFAADLNPAIGLLTEVISLAQQQYDRKKAVDSMTQVGPHIITHFISLLKQDVVIFYNVRMGLNDRAYLGELAETTILIKRYITLAKTINENRKVVTLTSRINTALAGLPGKRDGSPMLKPIAPEHSGTKMSKLEFEQLQDLAFQIDRSAEKLIALDNELNAYQKTISSYLNMIDHVDATLWELVAKAKSNGTQPPDRAALLNSVIRLKKAYQVYQDSKQ